MITKLNRRRGQKGFTLIELLIVVAIIGIIAAILIPNLIDALQKAKQKRTVGDMRDVGTAWFSWLTDQLSAASAGQGGTRSWDLTGFDDLTRDELLQTLYPTNSFFYIQEVPEKDGWATNYAYHFATDGALSAKVMAIRSFGRGGVDDGAPYTVGPFITTQYDRDIVWSDGFFVTYPAGAQVQ